MPLTEIEFELPAEQFALMGYPNLQQGHVLTLQLETVVPRPTGTTPGTMCRRRSWTPNLCVSGRAQYAFAGQITDADVQKSDDYESAAVIVQCGEIPVRVLCAPGPDYRLPYGTWETRYLTGYSRIAGIVEDDFGVVGKQVTVTDLVLS